MPQDTKTSKMTNEPAHPNLNDDRDRLPDLSQYQGFIAGQRFVQVDRLTVLTLSGKDCVSVLNNLCTADIKRLPQGEARELFVTDVRGKTLGHLVASQWEGQLRLVGSPDQGAALIAHIDRYVIREDVQIDDLSDSWGGIVLSGRTQPFVASSETPNAGDASIHDTAARGPLGSGIVNDAPGEPMWVHVPWTSQRDTLLLAPQEKIGTLTKWLVDQGYSPADNHVLASARIQAGWPIFGIDFDSSNLPQEIDRDATAISFNKGCYLGQETIARLDAMGQVQRKLVRVEIDGDVQPGAGAALSIDDQACGHLTSVGWSPERNMFLGLAMVRRRGFATGTVLRIADTSQNATVI